mmetsp:Transcript_4736/g.12432  ORF Transcript_4736/g.12432 Transcript_4736/m.12432 type:complete len:663 (+) Transcript_4736:275-2263(+)
MLSPPLEEREQKPSGSKQDDDNAAKNSKTVAETIIGEHEHVIEGYSLLKGIGDGEPIASDRFVIGGHEWVLLFYPDGKKSSAEGSAAHHHAHPHIPLGFARRAGGRMVNAPPPPPPGRRRELRNEEAWLASRTREDPDERVDVEGSRQWRGRDERDPRQDGAGQGNTPESAGPGDATTPPQGQSQGQGQGQTPAHTPVQDQQQQTPPHPVDEYGRRAYHYDRMDRWYNHPSRYIPRDLPSVRDQYEQVFGPAMLQQMRGPPEPAVAVRTRDTEVQYAALFVALIGETSRPMGVVHTSEGHIVRAFHHFTLVDQSGRGSNVTKGRKREQGAVKISCARQDPNARNCHGYRKFIRRSILENQESGYLLDDRIIIRYKIELVVMSGGAFCRSEQEAQKTVEIPPPTLNEDLGNLLRTGEGSDFSFKVEGELMPAHRLMIASRSPVFKALLENPMREGTEKIITIQDVRAPAFQVLLYFVYTDSLPPELSGENLEVTMAQHLLAAADRFELPRLRAICEQHLCETVDVANAATTLTLAEENHATELKLHCLDFISQNLSSVMATSGFEYMIQRCPSLQRSILQVCSSDPSQRFQAISGHDQYGPSTSTPGSGKGLVRPRDWSGDRSPPLDGPRGTSTSPPSRAGTTREPGSSSSKKGDRRVRFKTK